MADKLVNPAYMNPWKLFAVILLLAGFLQLLLMAKPTETPQPTPSPPPIRTPTLPPMPRLKPAPTPQPYLPQVSLEEAEATLGVKVPLPTYMMEGLSLGKVESIKESKYVYLNYRDANNVERININIHYHPINRSRADAIINRSIEINRDECGLTTSRVTVNGNLGFAREPGLQKNGYYAKGAVFFWTETLFIRVYGDYPASELIKVAESMPLGR